MYKLTSDPAIIQRIADGMFIPASQSNALYREFLKWKAAGNTPAPADPPPTPLDLSDVDNLEKVFKALALCVADVGGLTVPQMRALFKSKYDSL